MDSNEDKWAEYRCPAYTATIPEVNDMDINDEKHCPSIYRQSWSDTLHDIIYNFCRKNNILQQCNRIIPKSMFEIIALFYTNDITKNKSFKDYMNAILICKYFSFIKQTPRAHLQNANDSAIKKEYKLTKKSSLTTRKIFKALHTYKTNPFEINVKDFGIFFIDHDLSTNNLKRYSFPQNEIYNVSEQERNIIAAIRDTIKINNYENAIMIESENGLKSPLIYLSNELFTICKEGNFKSAIRLHTIIEYRDKALFAVDYSHTFVYFLFVFKYFTIIIHDKVTAERHTTRTMEAKVLSNRYRGILQELDKSGL